MRQRLVHQTAQNKRTAAKLTQYTINHILRRSTRPRRLPIQRSCHLSQAFTSQNCCQQTSGQQQAVTKRIRCQRFGNHSVINAFSIRSCGFYHTRFFRGSGHGEG